MIKTNKLTQPRPKTKIKQAQSKQKQQSATKLTKYCLNRPKHLEQFKNSSLFTNYSAIKNLQDYSQRLTYNQKTKSFEKQNFTQLNEKQYSELSFLQNFKQKTSISKNSMAIMKIKSKKSERKNTENQINLNTTGFYQNNNKAGVHQKKYRFKTSGYQSSRNSLKCKESTGIKQQRGHKMENHEFNKYFAGQIDKQNLKKYIRTNPGKFIPAGLCSLKKRCEYFQNLKRNKPLRQTLRSKQKKLAVISKNTIKSVKFIEENQKNTELHKEKQKKVIFKSLDEQISKFFDILSQLKNLGYSQDKTNEWVWQYCQEANKFLQKVLFKTQGCRSSLAERKIIYKLQDIQSAKHKIHTFKRTINNQQINLQTDDLTELNSYLEQILISKQHFEFKRLENQIEETSSAIKNNYTQIKDGKFEEILKLISTFQQKKKLKPIEYYEMLNFYDDVKRLQSHFGKIKGLNNSSKRKCENLTEIELEILRKNK